MPIATQALILAAGSAQRLLPLTESRPKGMLLVGGRPLLQHMVLALAELGVKDVILVTGRHGEKIQAFFQDGSAFGVKVHYVNQAEPTGTMAAIRLALPEVDLKRPSWIMPGHAYVTADLLRPAAKPGTTLLVATAGDGHVQGVPIVRGERLQGMRHEAPVVGSTRVTTNILHAGTELLAELSTGKLWTHKDLDLALGDWAGQGGSVRTVAADGPWHVLVDPWDVLRLNEWVLGKGVADATKKVRNARGTVHVGENTTIAPTAVLVGPVTIGDGCTVEDHCVIGPFVSVRNGTIIGAHSEVRRSILNNNVQVGSGAYLHGSVLDDGVRLGPRFLCEETGTPDGPRGCIIGRDASLPARSTLPGGHILPAESTGT
jgi:UDP-N-acetylglucosamine diphosphorylase / glucose-1-phosphate thymidylyltransferase / UDP-N-acetylgalactosamine diphosphorylase / glucosamine-1-phosphate N-acetyltransferase / galactosamine-1-phosphate N-acetyltransferase